MSNEVDQKLINGITEFLRKKEYAMKQEAGTVSSAIGEFFSSARIKGESNGKKQVKKFLYKVLMEIDELCDKGQYDEICDRILLFEKVMKDEETLKTRSGKG